MDSAALLVTAKLNPDLDGVACAIAYAELLEAGGTAAGPVVAGVADPEAQFVLEQLGVVVPDRRLSHGLPTVLVDMSASPGLPEFVDPEAVVEVIDHRLHGNPRAVFPNASIQVEQVGAAATLIAERFASAGRVPTAATALLLQAAIQSNTLRLQGSVTTDRDVAAAKALAGVRSLPEDFVARQFNARAVGILADLDGALVRETKTFEHPDGPFRVAQLELPGALELTGRVRRGLRQARTMLNLVDPVVPASQVLVLDPEFRSWVASRTGLSFEDDVASPHPVLLRKEIVAKLLVRE